MLILKALRDLNVMKNILYRELPQSISVLGGLLHILQNNACHLKMCVDSWPTFTTAICYRNIQDFSSSGGEDDGGLGAVPDICTVFTKDPDALRRLLVHPGVINWRDGLTFRSMPSSLIDLIKELASHNGLDLTDYGGYKIIMHHSPEKIASWQGKGLKLPISTLDESHAELVSSHLFYGGNVHTLNSIRACIRHLPNLCVKDGNGRPVSWVLSDELSEMRMAFALPEYRRAGHAQALTQAMVMKLSSMGLPIYGHVHEMNQPSLNLLHSLGFSLCSDREMVSFQSICRDKGSPV